MYSISNYNVVISQFTFKMQICTSKTKSTVIYGGDTSLVTPSGMLKSWRELAVEF